MQDSLSPPQSVATRATHAVRWNVLTFPLSAIASLLTAVLITRGIDKVGYAEFVFLTSLAQTVLSVSDLGISLAMSRFVPEIEINAGAGGLRRFLGSMLLLRISVLVIALAIMAALFSARLLVPVGDDPLELSIVLVSAIAVPQALWAVLLYFHYGRISQRAASLLQVTGSVVQLLATLAALASGLGIWGVLGAIALASTVQLGLGVLSTVGQLRSVSGAAANPYEYFGVSVRRIGTLAVAGYADKVTSLVGSFTFLAVLIAGTTSPTAYAAFGLAVAILGQFAAVLSVPMNGLLLPLFSNLRAQGDTTETGRAMRSAIRAYALMFISTGGAMAALAPAGIPLIFGAGYVSAVPFVQAMCILGALEFTVYPVGFAARITQGRYLKVYTARVALMVATIMAALISISTDVLTAVAVYAAVRVAVAWVLFSPGLPLESWLDSAFIARVALTTLAAWTVPALITATGDLGWATMVVAGLLGGASFTALFFGLGGVRQADRQLVRRVVGWERAGAPDRLFRP